MLNIAAYRFVDIADPAALRDRVAERCAAHALKGTVLVAPEGINLFLAGEELAVEGFLEELQADARFYGLEVKRSHSANVPFRRLRVKLKREIITFRAPQLRPARQTAPRVAPQALARWLRQGHDDAGRQLVLLDTRNRQEAALGTFRDALTLPIASFCELPQALEPHREALADKTVVSFCTGGIRCEKAAQWMLDAGYANVLQLDGGILGYFEQVGGDGYAGDCFVFDEREALDAGLRPTTSAPEA